MVMMDVAVQAGMAESTCENSVVDRSRRENACLKIEVRVLFSSSNVGTQKVYIPRIMHSTSRTLRQEHHAKNPGIVTKCGVLLWTE